MKISDLKKGDKVQMKNVGEVIVIGTARNYVRLKSDTMTLKLQFACSAAPLSILGLSMPGVTL
jgi:hypothetical protein